MKIVKFDPRKKEEILKECVKILSQNGLIVFPSDTVYGLLCDATSEKAVKKLISFKNRPPGKPISVFVKDFKMLKDLVKVDKHQEEVLKKLLPGPFTVVLPSKGRVVRLLESEKGTLGVRLVDFELVNELVSLFGRPLTATSANISGKGPHHSIDSFLKTLSQKKLELLDLIVDYGKLPFKKPSTVIDLTEGDIKILRRGEILLKNTKEFFSTSPKQTREIGEFIMKKNLSKVLDKGLVFIVEGELGVGKTQLAKGVGETLGVKKEIISPSFVGFFEYEAEKVEKFYHFDLWGVKEFSEIEEFKIPEIIGKGRVVFIEWGERIGQLIDELKGIFLLYIKIEYKGEKERLIKVSEVRK